MSFNTDGQAGLDDYGIDAPVEAQTRPPKSELPLLGHAHKFEPDKSPYDLHFRDSLPDIEGYSWEAAINQYGQAAGVEYWSRSSVGRYGDNEIEHENVPGEAAILVEGADRYLSKYALTALDFPPHYSKFESLANQYRWSVDGLTHIDWRFLKKCVRLANGSGRIDEEQTHLILCSPGAVVVSGPRGVFRVPLWRHGMVANNDPLPEPPDEAYYTIRGLEIPEEDPECRNALSRYIQFRNRSPYPNVDTHIKLDDSVDQCNVPVEVAHIFDTDRDGETIAVTENQLNIVHSHTENQPSLIGIHRYTIPEGQFSSIDGDIFTVNITPDMLLGAIGEEADVEKQTPAYETQESYRGTVVGYNSKWSLYKGVQGFSGQKKPVRLVFTVSAGLLTDTGEVKKQEVVSVEFPLQ